MTKYNNFALQLVVGFVSVGLILLLLIPSFLQSNGRKQVMNLSTSTILPHIVKCLDSLIRFGTDRWGNRHTHMIASILDLQTMSLPIEDQLTVPKSYPLREVERDKNGANLYADTLLIRTMKGISEITGDTSYYMDAQNYIKDFLQYASYDTLPRYNFNELLAWGEHDYYDLVQDRPHSGKHELLEYTPLWEEMWQISPQKVRKAITAIRKFHIIDNTYTFDRHAYASGNPAREEKRRPFLKHGALFIYSFAFLYSKTGNPACLAWIEGLVDFLWKSVNAKTSLIPTCSGPYCEYPDLANFQLVLAGYWLLRASQYLSGTVLKTQLVEKAKSILISFATYSLQCSPPCGAIFLDGRKANSLRYWSTDQRKSDAFISGLLYLLSYEILHEEILLKWAELVAKHMPWAIPEIICAKDLGQAILFYVELYKLTGKNSYLKSAHRIASIAVNTLLKNNLFAGESGGYPYYESKLGVPDLLYGLYILYCCETGLKYNIEY